MKSSAILDRIRTLLKDTPPFDQFDDAVREDLLGDISILYFEAGDVIIDQGNPVRRGLFIVESGLVRLMDVEQQRLIAKCSEGDLFGSFMLLKGGPSVYEAKAVEPTVCAMLQAKRFNALYEQNKDFATHFNRDLKLYFRRLGTTIDVSGAHLLLGQRLEQFVHHTPVTCGPDHTAREAAQRMNAHRVTSLLVMDQDDIAGILTDRDLRTRLIAPGLSLDTRVRALMSTPAVTISARASLFEAIMRMLTHHAPRLIITRPDDNREVPVGLITHRDVAHFRGLDPVATMKIIESRTSVSQLVDVRAEISEHLLRLYRQGVQPELLERLIVAIYDRIVMHVLRLVETELQASDDFGRVGLPWVWLRLGSSGRQEMALSSLQHNALLYADPASDKEQAAAERYFNELAERTNQALASCGFTPSAFVARDERWRMPAREWKQTYGTWIYEADETALAAAPVFFDVRGIYGDLSLVEQLKQDLGDALNIQKFDRQRRFLPLLAHRALEHRPPLTLLRRFDLERKGEQRHRFDMRERGILPVVDAARVLALETHFFHSTNTFDRLRHAANHIPELSDMVEDVLEAYQYLVDFRLAHQLDQVEAGEAPDDFIDPSMLTKIQQDVLRASFTAVAELQKVLANRFDVDLG